MFLVGRCDVFGAGVGHMGPGGVKPAGIMFQEIRLLMLHCSLLVFYIHSLVFEKLGGLVGLALKMLGVERHNLGENCLADRHCGSLLVCNVGNESPESAGK